ncbi:site-specific DNA-methyltransferase [Mycoplasmopsis phocirhinis]|uniref:site-specific DNA-methyltransferase n=1 Tax=Mycoplasmopsis phocirhinis TaxID=142650 RepID=UPI0029625733|nr:site-specific DNA-methyltransferase [Mycoplasmopsis phocirhinis]
MDPPYNTEAAKDDGNNSANDKENISASKFIYRDKFSRNGWLNMMNERLNLAKKLLKEDGVIFVSVDDNEQAYLKVLMDEIFGEENFVTNIVWHNNVKGRQFDKFIKNTYENIVMYSKNINNLNLTNDKLGPNTKSIFKDNISLYSKGYPLHNGTADFDINNRPNLCYSIYFNPQTKEAITRDEKEVENGNYFIGKSQRQDLLTKGFLRILPKINEKYGKQRVWRWSSNKFLREYKNELIYDSSDNYFYQKKRYSDDGTRKTKFKNYINIDGGSEKPKLLSIMNILIFTNPKPVELIKWIINIHPNKNARVLDFFAGSGTTGHAVLELNKEDGGNRTFTLVTNNENNIAQDVTYERLYRINHGLGTNNETFEWSKKNQPYKQNLNVFDLEYSPINIDQNQINTQYLIELLKHSLFKFGVSNTSDKDLINNLTNLYSLNKD